MFRQLWETFADHNVLMGDVFWCSAHVLLLESVRICVCD